MRLFVGLPLASEVLNELSEAVARLKTPQDGLRWTAANTWHITLQFLGNTDEQHCDCVLQQLAQVGARQFEVRLGTFGSFDRAGVFFVDVVPTPELVSLAQQVTAATAKCGFAAEARPYHPHITLARAKSGGRPLAALQDRAKRQAPFPQFAAAEFLLYESHTLPGGAQYEVRGRFPLNA
jgi:RNA 2',3'-cyclic 3'-phosphodiesterase